jgi:hypothetical protein
MVESAPPLPQISLIALEKAAKETMVLYFCQNFLDTQSPYSYIQPIPKQALFNIPSFTKGAEE